MIALQMIASMISTLNMLYGRRGRRKEEGVEREREGVGAERDRYKQTE